MKYNVSLFKTMMGAVVKIAFLFLSFFFFFSNGLHAQTMTEGAAWVDNARQYLTLNGQALALDERQLKELSRQIRCIKMNNYVCMKQGADPWRGSDGVNRNARDQDGHTVFIHPQWSIRAIVRDYCSKAKRGIDTALEIAETYTPWCDTLGSKAIIRGWGRTCEDGAQPPEAFAGPFCERPASGNPSAEQCSACNCPSKNAPLISRAVNLDMNEPLRLFNADGTVNVERMMKVVRAKVGEEIHGMVPSDDLLRDGIKLAGQCTGL